MISARSECYLENAVAVWRTGPENTQQYSSNIKRMTV